MYFPIVIFFIIAIVVFFILIGYKNSETAKKQPLENSKINLPRKKIEFSAREEEIYKFYRTLCKAAYDLMEKEKGWTDATLDQLYSVDMNYIESEVQKKYQLDAYTFNEILDEGDVLASRKLNSVQIAIQNRLNEVDSANRQELSMMLKVAKEFGVGLYEIEEALDLCYEGRNTE